MFFWGERFWDWRKILQGNQFGHESFERSNRAVGKEFNGCRALRSGHRHQHGFVFKGRSGKWNYSTKSQQIESIRTHSVWRASTRASNDNDDDLSISLTDIKILISMKFFDLRLHYINYCHFVSFSYFISAKQAKVTNRECGLYRIDFDKTEKFNFLHKRQRNA